MSQHPSVALTRVAAVTPLFNLNQFLSSLPAHRPAPQQVPNPAKARQTAPDSAPAQNEPNLARQSAPTPPGSSAPQRSIPPRAPNSANARQNSQFCETKPTPDPTKRPPRPLTPNQLRAAAFLVAGHSTNTIATTLKINRHTLARWKRLPQFQRELRHQINYALQSARS